MNLFFLGENIYQINHLLNFLNKNQIKKISEKLFDFFQINPSILNYVNKRLISSN
jgi:flagellar motor switch protein FliG